MTIVGGGSEYGEDRREEKKRDDNTEVTEIGTQRTQRRAKKKREPRPRHLPTVGLGHLTAEKRGRERLTTELAEEPQRERK